MRSFILNTVIALTCCSSFFVNATSINESIGSKIDDNNTSQSTNITVFSKRINNFIDTCKEKGFLLDANKFFDKVGQSHSTYDISENKFNIHKSIVYSSNSNFALKLDNVDTRELINNTNMSNVLFCEFLKIMHKLQFKDENGKTITAFEYFTQRYSLPKVNLFSLYNNSLDGKIDYLEFLSLIRQGKYKLTTLNLMTISTKDDFNYPSTWPEVVCFKSDNSYSKIELSLELRLTSNKLLADIVGLSFAILGEKPNISRITAINEYKIYNCKIPKTIRIPAPEVIK